MKQVSLAFCIGFGFCWGAIIAAGMAVAAAKGLDSLVEIWSSR